MRLLPYMRSDYLQIYSSNKHNWQILLHVTTGGNSWWVLAKSNTFNQLPMELAKARSPRSSWSSGYKAKNLSLVLLKCHLLANLLVGSLFNKKDACRYIHLSFQTSLFPEHIYGQQGGYYSKCGNTLDWDSLVTIRIKLVILAKTPFAKRYNLITRKIPEVMFFSERNISRDLQSDNFAFEDHNCSSLSGVGFSRLK